MIKTLKIIGIILAIIIFVAGVTNLFQSEKKMSPKWKWLENNRFLKMKDNYPD